MARLAQGRAASRPGLRVLAPTRAQMWSSASMEAPSVLPHTGSQAPAGSPPPSLPPSSLPRAGRGTGLPGRGTQRSLALSARGPVPLRWGSATKPKCTGREGRPQTTSTRLCSGGELQGSPVWQMLSRHTRRTLWRWSRLPPRRRDPDLPPCQADWKNQYSENEYTTQSNL